MLVRRVSTTPPSSRLGRTRKIFSKTTLGSALSVLFVLVIVSAGFLVNRILRFLKRCITYARTGYVAFKKKEVSPKRRLATALVGALMGAFAAAFYNRAPSFKVLLPR